MKSIYIIAGEGEFVDEEIAEIVMAKVIASARQQILKAAESGNMRDISTAVTALESPRALNEMFNIILGKIIPLSRTVYIKYQGQQIGDLDFREKYIDTFDEDGELAKILLKAMADRIKSKGSSSDKVQ